MFGKIYQSLGRAAYLIERESCDYLKQHVKVLKKTPDNTALLWQKEASDIPSKFELLMFSYFAYRTLLPGQILCINTHPAKRYVRYKKDIMIFH